MDSVEEEKAVAVGNIAATGHSDITKVIPKTVYDDHCLFFGPLRGSAKKLYTYTVVFFLN